MPTADELLRNVALQPNPEGHIVVGGDRRITIPDNLKRLGVQFDHNMETVTFDCPRYWDERDMSEMAVYINYRLSNGYMDRYPVDNVRADGDVMHFDWTISKNVTQVPGVVSFLICVTKTDSEGNEERHWNSELSQEAYISPGMETEEHPALEYPDEVTQLLLRMATVEQINVQAEEMRSLYADTVDIAVAAEETKNQALDASNHIKNSYASAIKGNVSGEVIRVDDVSPIEHDVKCWVHGKNLINVADMSYQDYTGYHKPIALGFEVVVGQTYTLSMDVESTREPFVASVGFGSKDSYYIDGTYTQNLRNGHIEITFTPTEKQVIRGRYLHIRAPRYSTSETYSASISNMQLELGPVQTAYEPYVDPTIIMLNGYGKNIARASYGYNVTHNGINIVGTKDSSEVILNGVSEKANSYKIMKEIVLAPGTYTASVIGANVVDSASDRIYVCDSVSGAVLKNYIMTDKPQTFSVDELMKVDVEMVFAQNSKYSYTPVRFQIEKGDTATSYEAYKSSSVTPSSDGTCVVTSKSPTMTLFTDTLGVIIEAEYNVNTKTWVENYLRDNAPSGGSGEGGSAPRLTTISLLASAWVTTSASLHSQVVTIAGITSNSRVDLFPTVAQLATFHEKDVAFVTENDNGTVTVYAIGDKPLNDYTMQAQITEVLR